jgi:very-short-patch-repair endonuclease
MELDGGFHFNDKTKQDDKKKTNYINSLGIKVIRFENQEVLYDLEKVLDSIKKKFTD